jgi:hypothetical protein
LLLRHVALMGEQVVLADFVGFGDVSGSVMEYVIGLVRKDCRKLPIYI